MLKRKGWGKKKKYKLEWWHSWRIKRVNNPSILNNGRMFNFGSIFQERGGLTLEYK